LGTLFGRGATGDVFNTLLYAELLVIASAPDFVCHRLPQRQMFAAFAGELRLFQTVIKTKAR
jgi:hypothetical protein